MDRTSATKAAGARLYEHIFPNVLAETADTTRADYDRVIGSHPRGMFSFLNPRERATAYPRVA